MFITLYHWRMLPVEVRTNFELPAWPYTEDQDHYLLFRDYMRNLNVFHYQDNELEDGGKNIAYPIMFGYNMQQIKEWPFMAFMSQCHISYDDLKIIENPGDRSEGFALLEKLKKHPIAKDNMAWVSWNVPVNITSISPNGIVSRYVLYDYLDDELSCNSDCDKYRARKPGLINVKNQK